MRRAVTTSMGLVSSPVRNPADIPDIRSITGALSSTPSRRLLRRQLKSDRKFCFIIAFVAFGSLWWDEGVMCLFVLWNFLVRASLMLSASERRQWMQYYNYYYFHYYYFIVINYHVYYHQNHDYYILFTYLSEHVRTA